MRTITMYLGRVYVMFDPVTNDESDESYLFDIHGPCFTEQAVYASFEKWQDELDEIDEIDPDSMIKGYIDRLDVNEVQIPLDEYLAEVVKILDTANASPDSTERLPYASAAYVIQCLIDDAKLEAGERK